MRYLKCLTYYFCHEEPREFYYDKWYLNTNIKIILINLARYPLKFIDKYNTLKANLLITNSYYSQKKLEKIYKKIFYVCRLGVNTSVFKPLNIKKQNFYITVGAASKFKGIDFLFIYLPGPYYYKYITKLAKQLNIKLKFLTNISDIKLCYLYNSAKLYLAAAINEPFGLSLLEALSCGLPVIGVNEGGYKEIINNKFLGELVVRNEKKFSESILKWIIKDINKYNMYTYMRKNWNWNKTIHNLQNILKDTYENRVCEGTVFK